MHALARKCGTQPAPWAEQGTGRAGTTGSVREGHLPPGQERGGRERNILFSNWVMPLRAPHKWPLVGDRHRGQESQAEPCASCHPPQPCPDVEAWPRSLHRRTSGGTPWSLPFTASFAERGHSEAKEPSVHQSINKRWSFHTMKCYFLSLKGEEILSLATTRMNLEAVMPGHKKANAVRFHGRECVRYSDSEGRKVAWGCQGLGERREGESCSCGQVSFVRVEKRWRCVLTCQ